MKRLTIGRVALAACVSLGLDCENARGPQLEPDAWVDPLDASAPVDATVAPTLDAWLDARFAPLIDNEAFRRYDAAVDPLAAHQPASIACPPSATYLEYDAFEVDSTRRNYLLAEAPALRDVAVGSLLRVTFLHYDLRAPAPAEAHVAVLFGDVVQWEARIPIPTAGAQIKTGFRAVSPLAFGEPVRLHLHNHGGNTYLVEALEVESLTP